MGLFQHRPEEPTEWGGLPSEPWEPREPAEVLADPMSFDVSLWGTLPAHETIALSVESFGIEPSGPPEDLGEHEDGS